MVRTGAAERRILRMRDQPVRCPTAIALSFECSECTVPRHVLSTTQHIPPSQPSHCHRRRYKPCSVVLESVGAPGTMMLSTKMDLALFSSLHRSPREEAPFTSTLAQRSPSALKRAASFQNLCLWSLSGRIQNLLLWLMGIESVAPHTTLHAGVPGEAPQLRVPLRGFACSRT